MTENKDRLSELTADIKQRIVGRLCMREAIATSLLSRVWRDNWVTLPNIDFGFTFFCQFSCYFDTLAKTHNNNYNNYNKQIVYVQLLHKLWKIYTKYSESLSFTKKLYIYVPMFLFSGDPQMSCFASDVVSRWLLLATPTQKHNNNNVQDLLCFIDDGVFDYCKLFAYAPMLCDSKTRDHVSHLGLLLQQQHLRRLVLDRSTLQNISGILESESLTSLRLLGCNLMMSEKEAVVGVSIRLPFLKQLCLELVNIDQKLLDAVLVKCKALEKLRLHSCEGVKVVQVLGLSKLKDVSITQIRGLSRVEIDDSTPLTRLHLIKLEKSRFIVKMACKELVELLVDGCGISDDFFDNAGNFPHLKDLTLFNCPKLACIKITSSCLTSFRSNNIVTLVSNFQIQRACLILKRPFDAHFDPIPWRTKLAALLANFSQSTHLHLETDSKKNLISPKELQEGLCSPLRGVKNIYLRLSKSLKKRDVLYYLDCLLWLSPNSRTISISSEKSKLLLELQYEDGMENEESCGCYPTHPINCWRRVLKDFRIVSHRGLGDADSIRKLLENALQWNKASATCA